uniref:28S ribosomal protein S18c, mitochondrial n=1 Tax=Lygus hesperus TaxID=30085 RepID=A0A0A9WTH3_LYGHE
MQNPIYHLVNRARSMGPILLPRYIHSSVALHRNAESSGAPTNDMPIEMENPFKKEKVECILCKMKIDPDYKNVRLLSQFVSPFTGLMYGRHITGLCRTKHERVAREISKSQNAGMMPYYNKEPEFLEDPKLFNPDRPVRSHEY